MEHMNWEQLARYLNGEARPEDQAEIGEWLSADKENREIFESLKDKWDKTANMNKEQYNVDKASGLKCPVCAVFFQYPGSLWWKPTIPLHFVCRKCHLELDIKCLTLTNETLISELKAIGKGEQAFPSWMRGNITGDEE